jgi:hypothetical protein
VNVAEPSEACGLSNHNGRLTGAQLFPAPRVE